jgi:hypothetical protein
VCQHLVKGVFRVQDFGGSRISPLILADNYNKAATANHKGTKAQRTHKEIRSGPPALRSFRATARGPGRPGSRHSSADGRSGGLPCGLSSRGVGRPVGPRSRISREGAKPRSSDERRTIFPRAIGPRRWRRLSIKAIRGDSRRPPGGPGCLASARAR